MSLPRSCIIGIYCVLISFPSLAQVDLRGYVSESFFSVTPTVDPTQIAPSLKDLSVDRQWYQNNVDLTFKKWYSGNYEEAINSFIALGERVPESPEVDYYIGFIHYENFRYAEARKSFERSLTKEAWFLDAAYMLGIIALEENQFKIARDYFRKLVELKTYRAKGEYGLGLLALYEFNNFYVAQRHFSTSIESDPQFAYSYLALINVQIWIENYKNALETAEVALKIYPNWEKIIILRGLLDLIVNEDTDHFEYNIDQLNALSPENPHYYAIQGYMYAEIGNYEEAVNEFRKAYSIKVSTDENTNYNFTTIFGKNDVLARPINYYYFEEYNLPDRAKRYISKGIIHLLKGESEDASKEFDRANDIKPNTSSYTFAGLIFQNRATMDNEKIAIQKFSRAIELDSGNWLALLYRGQANLRAGNEEAALNDFSNLIAKNPKDEEGYKYRGDIYLSRGLYQKAFKDYSMAIAINPNDPKIIINRTIAALGLGNSDQARNDISAISDNLNYQGEVYYLKSLLFRTAGDSVRSIQMLDSASTVLTTNIGIHKELLSLGQTLNMDRYIALAYDRLIKVQPLEFSYILERAKYLIKAGKYAEAIADLEIYTEGKNSDGEGYYWLSQAYRNTGNEKEAEKNLKKADRFGYDLAN